MCGFDIDTSHFLGDHPPFASVYGLSAARGTSYGTLRIPDTFFVRELLQPLAASHLRLNIFLDGVRLDHPMRDLAKGMMLLAYAGTGIFLSDGATNVMPVGPHADANLSAPQQAQYRSVEHGACQLAHRHIVHSLRGGFYQGWDLHPGPLPVRYATCYAFFLQGLHQAADRLRNFIDKASQAILVGEVFDDAATGQGLLNYFLRALNCGAIDLRDAEQTGLTQQELGLRCFAELLGARRERLQAG